MAVLGSIITYMLSIFSIHIIAENNNDCMYYFLNLILLNYNLDIVISNFPYRFKKSKNKQKNQRLFVYLVISRLLNKTHTNM